MIKIFFFFILLSILGCNKPKTVLVCGDHVCINKAEAEQFFEDNLSLEVKIISNKKIDKIDLVVLNLKSDEDGNKEIFILDKENSLKNLKILTNDEIKKKKIQLKKREKAKNKKIKKNKQVRVKKTKIKKNNEKKTSKIKKNINKTRVELIDICTILEKCNIDEISKYLINQGSKKRFPDISSREQ